MWPFSCKECIEKDKHIKDWKWLAQENCKERKHFQELSTIKWHPLSENPPINTNLLVANKDFSYFGFLYMDDGWDNSRRINMQSKDLVWPTYTNTESIAWWLNLDLIKRGSNDSKN